MSKRLPTPTRQTVSSQVDRRLTAAEFQGLADVPPELEWFANIGLNPEKVQDPPLFSRPLCQASAANGL